MSTSPVVLVFAGHDPSGAAGVQADIETITANGCRCVSVITALTAQNTSDFEALYPQGRARFRKQARLLTADIRTDACKLGLIGSAGLVEEIAGIIAELPARPPVVLDPVLATGTGKTLVDRELVIAMRKQLFGLTTIATPNAAEARKLTHRNDIREAAEVLMRWGCSSVLVTGTDEPGTGVINRLFGRDFDMERYEWERLPGVYHGSGCTLSASIAAGLARGQDIRTAVARAQEFTWQSLKHGSQIGTGQMHPDRFFKQK